MWREILDETLRVVDGRATSSPLPPKAWLERALEVCRKHSHSNVARTLYERISGRPLESGS